MVPSMSSEECFAAWAPDDVLWSEWVKPVAFMQAGDLLSPDPIDATQLPALTGTLDRDSTIVVDLPGAEAVYAGLALVTRGFRPIPLFNGTSGPSEVIDVMPIARALNGGLERLKRARLDQNAPPAFLLDSRRNGENAAVGPGSYDNRWVALPQDFPSGALLASRGIRTATVIQRDSPSVRPDLVHVLLRWQDSGIQLRLMDLATGRPAQQVTLTKPSGFKLAWYAAVALLGLRRSNVGGFGSTIPEQTARSGFYG
jgi:hypothetical protein